MYTPENFFRQDKYLQGKSFLGYTPLYTLGVPRGKVCHERGARDSVQQRTH